MRIETRSLKQNLVLIAQSSVLCAVLCAMLFALCVCAEAQQTKKLSRIGYLSSIDSTNESARAAGIRRALYELGYVEGQNIATEYRYSEGKTDRASESANEFARLKVDIIIVAGGIIWIRAAKNATKTTPIVMVGAGNDPIEAGLIESLGRPGGNITGLTNLSGKLGAKQLELLKEAVPKIVRVAVVYEAATPANLVQLKEVQAAASMLKLTVQAWDVRAVESYDSLFAALNKDRTDGLHLLGSPLINNSQKQLASLALKSRLPSVYQSREAVDAGGLMSYSADLADSYRRVAYYVDKILRGVRPADLPVEQPTKFELAINLTTAKQLGLIIPPHVLGRADKVIR
jgi:putative tryptophan/tyrosine transport system substrate-binding protein